MTPDNIPWSIAIPLAALLWLGYFRKPIANSLRRFFERRRMNRAIRKFANGRVLYDVNTIRKPEAIYVPRRRR